MHLARRRHVDHDVAADPRRAAEPVARRAAAGCRGSRARSRRRAQRLGGRVDPPLGERPDARRRPGSARRCPRPPHTVSRSAPSWRAASSTVVPASTLPSSPDGVNTTRCDAANATAPTRPGAGGADPRGCRPRRRARSGRGWPGSTPRSRGRCRPARRPPCTADFTSGCSGFMIADVIPAPIAMARNVPVTTWRLGSPKLMFDAPQVVLTLQLLAQPADQPERLLAGLAQRADRHHERVDDDVVRPGCRGRRPARRCAWRPRSARRDPR